jgi:hypothetical protein
MDSVKDPHLSKEIQSDLGSIVEISEKWLGRLKEREFRVRLASAFLTTLLVFGIVGISALLYVVVRFGYSDLSTVFFQNSGVMNTRVASFIGIAGFAGLLCGWVTYLYLRSGQNAKLKEISTLIAQMKSVDGSGSTGITEDALLLAEKLVNLLPELVRNRSRDSIVFGMAAFVLAAAIGNNLAVGSFRCWILIYVSLSF